MTTVRLYQTLNDHQDSVIVFDDCDSVFRNTDANNFLKAATDTAEPRVIKYRSRGALPENCPREFQFRGKIVIITNRESFEPALRGRALRCERVEFNFLQKMGMLYGNLRDIKPNIDLRHKLDVFNIIHNVANHPQFTEERKREFTFRMYISCLTHHVGRPPSEDPNSASRILNVLFGQLGFNRDNGSQQQGQNPSARINPQPSVMPPPNAPSSRNLIGPPNSMFYVPLLIAISSLPNLERGLDSDLYDEVCSRYQGSASFPVQARDGWNHHENNFWTFSTEMISNHADSRLINRIDDSLNSSNNYPSANIQLQLINAIYLSNDQCVAYMQALQSIYERMRSMNLWPRWGRR